MGNHERLTVARLEVPYSIEAEQSVLGGLLLNNRAWFDLSDKLSADDFYTQDHRTIFSAIGELLNAAKPCDFVTLSEHLKHQGRSKLDDAGGISYLGTLAADTPSAANVRGYAEIVRQKSVLRSLIATGQDLAELGYHPEGRSPDELMAKADEQLSELRNRGARGKNQAEMYSTILDRVEAGIDARQAGEAPGLMTGFPDLDEKIAGLKPGHLIIVGGRPGMGKTTFALNIADHAAIDLRVPVLVFSLEMERDELAMRTLSSRGDIDFEKLRIGNLDQLDFNNRARVGGELRRAPIAIDDTPGMTPTEMRARARRFKAKHGLGLIVVDYLQLMSVGGKRQGANRESEISECSRSLKALAKELGVPVIALTQLSRSVESRENKRPHMSDTRESGAIEQDADLMLLIYRDDYYDKKSPHAGIAEVIIAKQRGGKEGTVELSFEGQFCRFSSYTGPAWGERKSDADKTKPVKQGFRSKVASAAEYAGRDDA